MRLPVFQKVAIMEIGDILEGLKKPGKTRKGLAEALGRQPQAITALLKGDRDLKAREIPIVARYLDIVIPEIENDPEVLARDARRPGLREADIHMAPSRDVVPIYGTQERQDGVLLIGSEPFEFIDRPPILWRIPKAYVAMVSGDTQSPAFRAGDAILVNPALPHVSGEDYVLRTKTAGGLAIIREVLDHDAETIVIRQFNPELTTRVTKADWPIMHRIAGKNARR